MSTFVDRCTGQVSRIGGFSVAWAAIFGPLWVFAHGFVVLAFVMLGISASLVVGCGCLVEYASKVVDGPASGWAIGIMVVPAVVLILGAHGMAAGQLVCLGYLQHGWREIDSR